MCSVLESQCLYGTCATSANACLCDAGYGPDRTFFWDVPCALPSSALSIYAAVYSAAILISVVLIASVFEHSSESPKREIWRSALGTLCLFEAFVLALFGQGGMHVAAALLWGVANVSFFVWTYFVVLSVLAPLQAVKHVVLRKKYPQGFVFALAVAYFTVSLAMASEAAVNNDKGFNAAATVGLGVHFVAYALLCAFAGMVATQLHNHIRAQLPAHTDQGHSAQEERQKMQVLQHRLQRLRILFFVLGIAQLVVLMWFGIRLGLDTTPYMFVANFCFLFVAAPFVCVIATAVVCAKVVVVPKPDIAALAFTSPKHVIQVQIRRTASLTETMDARQTGTAAGAPHATRQAAASTIEMAPTAATT